MLAISTDDLSGAERLVTKARGNIPFPILYDPEARVIPDYGAAKEVGRLAVPITFMIDQGGIIRWKYIGTPLDRPPTSLVLDQLQILPD